MSRVCVYDSRGAAQTLALGLALGSELRGGDFLALSGPLGAGKTQLVKGLALGLGVPEDEPVTSPTYVLIREYAGRVTLYHVDAYRLSGTSELLDLGLEEIAAEPDAVVVVEWADRVPGAIPADAVLIELEHTGVDDRRLTIKCAKPERANALRHRITSLEA